MWGSIVAGISGYTSGRSRRWWTGENSWFGKTFGADDQSYQIPERNEDPKPNPLIYLAIAYFIFK
jgi:hypothetical protein